MRPAVHSSMTIVRAACDDHRVTLTAADNSIASLGSLCVSCDALVVRNRFYGNTGPARHRRSGLFVLLMSVLALGAIVGAIVGIAKTDDGLGKIASQVESVSEDCNEVLSAN